MSPRIDRRTLLAYGSGSLGTGLFSSVPGILLLFFMTDTLGIRAELATLAIFVPKIWDVVTDPVAGYLSDRTRSRWGRRHPWLLVGAVALPVTFALLFNVPVFADEKATFLYVMAIFAAGATAFTAFQVPYVAMVAEMSEDPAARTVIMGYRMSFVTAGIGLGTVLAPLLVAFFGGGRGGYGSMSIAIAALCGLSMLTTVAATLRVPLASSATPTASLRGQLGQVRRNRPFVVLASSYVLMLTGLGVFGAAVPYYVANVLVRQDVVIGYVFLAYLAGSLCSLPIWALLARRIGKVLSLQISAVMFFLPALLIFLLPSGNDPGILFAEVTALGASFGGMQLLPFSMLTDTIQLDEQRSGAQSGGAYSGIWTAGEKLGLAFGAAFMGLFLSVSGYVESTGHAVAQPESAIIAVRAAFTLGPALFVAAGLVLLPLYRLSESDLSPLAPSGSTGTATPSPPP